MRRHFTFAAFVCFCHFHTLVSRSHPGSFRGHCPRKGTSQVARWVKNPPAMQEKQETRTQPLGPKDPLEAGMAPHSSVPVRRIPWTEGLAGSSPQGRPEPATAGVSEHTRTHTRKGENASFFPSILVTGPLSSTIKPERQKLDTVEVSKGQKHSEGCGSRGASRGECCGQC